MYLGVAARRLCEIKFLVKFICDLHIIYWHIREGETNTHQSYIKTPNVINLRCRSHSSNYDTESEYTHYLRNNSKEFLWAHHQHHFVNQNETLLQPKVIDTIRELSVYSSSRGCLLVEIFTDGACFTVVFHHELMVHDLQLFRELNNKTENAKMSIVIAGKLFSNSSRGFYEWCTLWFKLQHSAAI